MAEETGLLTVEVTGDYYEICEVESQINGLGDNVQVVDAESVE